MRISHNNVYTCTNACLTGMFDKTFCVLYPNTGRGKQPPATNCLDFVFSIKNNTFYTMYGIIWAWLLVERREPFVRIHITKHTLPYFKTTGCQYSLLRHPIVVVTSMYFTIEIHLSWFQWLFLFWIFSFWLSLRFQVSVLFFLCFVGFWR